MTRLAGDDFEAIALEVLVSGETEAALGVCAARPPGWAGIVWLPKQLVELGPQAADGTARLVLRRGLARTKGMVR